VLGARSWTKILGSNFPSCFCSGRFVSSSFTQTDRFSSSWTDWGTASKGCQRWTTYSNGLLKQLHGQQNNIYRKTTILLKQDKRMQELKIITGSHSHHSYKRQANTARVKMPQQQCHNVPKHNKQKTENNPRPQWLNQNNPLAYTTRVKVMHNMPKLQWKGHSVKEQWLTLWPQI